MDLMTTTTNRTGDYTPETIPWDAAKEDRRKTKDRKKKSKGMAKAKKSLADYKQRRDRGCVTAKKMTPKERSALAVKARLRSGTNEPAAARDARYRALNALDARPEDDRLIIEAELVRAGIETNPGMTDPVRKIRLVYTPDFHVFNECPNKTTLAVKQSEAFTGHFRVDGKHNDIVVCRQCGVPLTLDKRDSLYYHPFDAKMVEDVMGLVRHPALKGWHDQLSDAEPFTTTTTTAGPSKPTYKEALDIKIVKKEPNEQAAVEADVGKPKENSVVDHAVVPVVEPKAATPVAAPVASPPPLPPVVAPPAPPPARVYDGFRPTGFQLLQFCQRVYPNTVSAVMRAFNSTHNRMVGVESVRASPGDVVLMEVRPKILDTPFQWLNSLLRPIARWSCAWHNAQVPDGAPISHLCALVGGWIYRALKWMNFIRRVPNEATLKFAPHVVSQAAADYANHASAETIKLNAHYKVLQTPTLNIDQTEYLAVKQGTELMVEIAATAQPLNETWGGQDLVKQALCATGYVSDQLTWPTPHNARLMPSVLDPLTLAPRNPWRCAHSPEVLTSATLGLCGVAAVITVVLTRDQFQDFVLKPVIGTISRAVFAVLRSVFSLMCTRLVMVGSTMSRVLFEVISNKTLRR